MLTLFDTRYALIRFDSQSTFSKISTTLELISRRERKVTRLPSPIYTLLTLDLTSYYVISILSLPFISYTQCF